MCADCFVLILLAIFALIGYASVDTILCIILAFSKCVAHVIINIIYLAQKKSKAMIQNYWNLKKFCNLIKINGVSVVKGHLIRKKF